MFGIHYGTIISSICCWLVHGFGFQIRKDLPQWKLLPGCHSLDSTAVCAKPQILARSGLPSPQPRGWGAYRCTPHRVRGGEGSLRTDSCGPGHQEGSVHLGVKPVGRRCCPGDGVRVAAQPREAGIHTPGLSDTSRAQRAGSRLAGQLQPETPSRGHLPKQGAQVWAESLGPSGRRAHGAGKAAGCRIHTPPQATYLKAPGSP